MALRIINLDYTDNIKKDNLCLCLGFFDGMHKAHTALIKQAVKIGRKEGLQTAMFTFSMNVLNFIKHKQHQCLTTKEDKAEIASALGIEVLYVMQVSEELVHMSASAFINKFLIHAKHVVVGTDFRFGYRNTGDVELLKKNSNFTTTVVPEITFHNKKISSSSIREILMEGDIPLANFLLGREFKIKGKVIIGNRIGRELGYPTANISYFPYLLPKPGVYFTKVGFHGNYYYGLTNIGVNPTFGNSLTTVETYIFGIQRDLYDLEIEIYFKKFLRVEEKFKSKDNLIEQINLDIEKAKTLIEMEERNEKN